MSKFWFKAWIHQISGNDYSISGEIVCVTRSTAIKEVKKILKKEGSIVLTDYKVKEELHVPKPIT
jgi:enoyl-[acyl-carrier-protein] reductase (NADH)